MAKDLGQPNETDAAHLILKKNLVSSFEKMGIEPILAYLGFS